MDLANCNIFEDNQQSYNNISVSPSLVDSQGDIFQCGLCKQSFCALIDFLSHKREHISLTSSINSPYQLLVKSDGGKLDLNQPSNHIFIWNSSDPTSEAPHTVSSDEEVYREQSLTSTKTIEYLEHGVEENNKSAVDAELMSVSDVPPQQVPNDLSCSICQRVFKKQFDMFLHLRTHTGEKPFQCIVCGRTFSHKSNLKKHVATHRVWPDGLNTTIPQHGVGAGLGYHCPYCQKCLNTYLNFKTHLKDHGHIKVYKCIQSKCLDMFVDLESLISHINKFHEMAEYHCHICSAKFPSLAEVSAHQQAHSTALRVGPRTKHTCIYCHAAFKKHDHLSHHLSTANHKNNCSHCNKSFTSERALRRHLILHKETKDFRCEICGSKFKLKSYFNSHMLTHSKEKNFMCTICNVKFTRKDILKRHIKSHQPNKKKHCPFRSHLGCMMEFTRTDKLNLHVKTHTHKVGGKKRTKPNTKCIENSEHSTIEIIIVPLSETQTSVTS